MSKRFLLTLNYRSSEKRQKSLGSIVWMVRRNNLSELLSLEIWFQTSLELVGAKTKTRPGVLTINTYEETEGFILSLFNQIFSCLTSLIWDDARRRKIDGQWHHTEAPANHPKHTACGITTPWKAPSCKLFDKTRHGATLPSKPLQTIWRKINTEALTAHRMRAMMIQRGIIQ